MKANALAPEAKYTLRHDPHSYQSLTEDQQDECARLFRESENTPTLFHTASPACQDYVERVTIYSYAQAIQKINNPMVNFVFGYATKMISKDVAALDACTNFLFDAIKSVTLPNQPTRTSYDDCMKKMDEAEEYKCTKAKKEYLEIIKNTELKDEQMFKSYTARVPSKTATYQELKLLSKDILEKLRQNALKYDCHVKPKVELEMPKTMEILPNYKPQSLPLAPPIQAKPEPQAIQSPPQPALTPPPTPTAVPKVKVEYEFKCIVDPTTPQGQPPITKCTYVPKK